jgi:hypothetical protein
MLPESLPHDQVVRGAADVFGEDVRHLDHTWEIFAEQSRFLR